MGATRTWFRLMATIAIVAAVASACTRYSTVEAEAPAASSTEPSAVPTPSPTPPPAPTPQPLEEVAFRQSGGLLNCADGETRMGSMFWADEQAANADTSGFFGYSDTTHLGTYVMSPIAEDAPENTQNAVVITPGEPLLPATINFGSQECTFENNEYTSYSMYTGSFECTEIDADRSFILQEHAPGEKLFLAWMPSNAPGYVMSILDEGKGTFKARGIDDGSVLETVALDFAFDEQLRDGRSRLTMSGELLYQDDPVAQSCAGTWDAVTLPPDTTAAVSEGATQSERDENLRYVHDSATRIWADDIVVYDNGTAYPIPADYVAVEHGKATDRSQITVEMQWIADDGNDISVHFYTRHDGEQWWSYEIRTKVDQPNRDGDWVYYPGDNDTFFWNRENGVYFRSPLGTSYQGNVLLDSLAVTNLRFEAFAAEFPVDAATDLGERPPRPDYLEATKLHRFETEFALLDADAAHIIVDGERSAPAGEIRVSAPSTYVGHTGYQEIEINWRANEDAVGEQLMLYFRTDGSQWYISRLRASRGDSRVDVSDLALAATPLGDVFEGDIVTDHVELRGVRLELTGCDGRPGLLHLRCPLDE